jgi:hypothetical protein
LTSARRLGRSASNDIPVRELLSTAKILRIQLRFVGIGVLILGVGLSFVVSALSNGAEVGLCSSLDW